MEHARPTNPVITHPYDHATDTCLSGDGVFINGEALFLFSLPQTGLTCPQGVLPCLARAVFRDCEFPTYGKFLTSLDGGGSIPLEVP